MSEQSNLVISTSSLATALFISITVHIICGIYCLLKSHFKRSTVQPKDSASDFHCSSCHTRSHPFTQNSYRHHDRIWSSSHSLPNPNDCNVLRQSSKMISDTCLNEDANYNYNPSLIETFNDGFPLLHSMRELYKVTERSLTQTVGSKLIVSVSHLVTDGGDTLHLDNTGISLHIPAGAVQFRKKQLISLVLNWDLSDNPFLDRCQSLVSPVIYCGPHGLKLNKSCTLVYKHCAYKAKHLNIMISETELCGQKNWQRIENLNNNHEARKDSSRIVENHEKTAESPFTVTQDECRLNISSFTLYTAIMSIPNEDDGGKWLQVAVFSLPLHSDEEHHQTRLYFLNKTPCALQWAIQNESKFGSSMCCPEKVFLFSSNQFEGGKDMLIRTTYVSENWELIDDVDDSNRVSFLYIWHGKCPYASVCFRRKTKTHVNGLQGLSIQFAIYQEDMEHAGEKINLHTLPVSKSCRSSPDHMQNEWVCMKHRDSQININVSLNQRANQLDLYEAGDQLKCQRIPQDLRLKLRLLLDPPCTFGNNWKLLASEMGYDSTVQYLSTTESPTEELMNILEHKMTSLDDLWTFLQNIGRLDAMKEVEDFCAKNC